MASCVSEEGDLDALIHMAKEFCVDAQGCAV